jgi:hypothetical protein
VLLALQGRWRAVGDLAPRPTQGTARVSGEPRPQLARHAPPGHRALTPSGSPA